MTTFQPRSFICCSPFHATSAEPLLSNIDASRDCKTQKSFRGTACVTVTRPVECPRELPIHTIISAAAWPLA